MPDSITLKEVTKPFDRVAAVQNLDLTIARGALWFCAKVFRIGLLMFGKAPNLATLIRWARAA